MDKLRQFGEPVFWAIVVLSTLPAILSNSVVPANWFIPFSVEANDRNIFGAASIWIWATLFVLSISFAAFYRSIWRGVAALPLLVLWLMPIDQIDIDFSHPTDGIYLDAQTQLLFSNNSHYGRPDDLKHIDIRDDVLIFASIYELLNNLAKYLPDQFGDISEINDFAEKQHLLYDILRQKAGIETPDPARVEQEASVLGESDLLPSDALLSAVATAQPTNLSFLNKLMLPASFKLYRSETLAMENTEAESYAIRTFAIGAFVLQSQIELYTAILSLAALLTLIILSLIGQLRMIFAGLILLIGISYSISAGSIIPAFGALQIFLFIAFLVFAQSFIRTNGAFFVSLGRPKNLRNFVRTLLPWSFFLLLFAGSIIISSKVTSIVGRQVYEIGVPKSLPPEQQFFYVAESGEGLEADLRYAAQDHYSYLNSATSGAAIAFRDNYNDNDKTAITETMDSLERAILPYIFGKNDFQHCLKPPDLLCPLVNAIKSSINWSYKRARDRQLAKIELALTELSGRGKDAVNSGVDTLNENIGQATREASQWTVKGISSLFLIYHIVTTLSNIFLTFVLVKSFLFIASRVYLHADTENQNLWEGMAREGGAGIPVGREKTYIFERARWGTFFVRRGQSNKNIKRDISWPQWQYMILRRFATRMFALYREDWSRDHGEKFVKTTKGGEFVEWELAEGQRVVFNLKNLAAFSETVKLRSLWSFRLSHFIFGRVLFSSAEGPGMILLRTNGEPHIGKTDERYILGAAPNEHIAFDLATDFLVNSDLKIKNIYFSDIEVVANDSPRVVVDVMPEHSFAGGAARFIRAFFIPV